MTRDTDRMRAAGARFTRRDFGRLAGGAGLMLAGGAFAPRRALAASGADLTVFEWSGYDIPEMAPGYHEKYGAPTFAIFAEEEEAFQKLRAGFKVDVAHPCTLSLARWRDAGLLAPLDTSRIPRWGDIPAPMLDFKGIATGGNTWMQPFDWGNSTIIYRHDEIGGNPDSYELMIDPALEGRVSIFDSVDEVFCWAAGLLGYETHMELSDDQLAKCGDAIRKLHRNVRFYWTDPTQLQQAMASGELQAAWTWTDSYTALRWEEVPVTFMFPKEGLSTWMCGFVRIKGGEGSEEQAYEYLNAALDPQVGKYLIDQWGYGHSNTKAYELSESQIAADIGMTKDINKFLKGSRFQGEIAPAQREKMIELFETIKLGG